MKKKLKRYGNTLIISFSKEDQEVYGLVEGDVMDLGDMLIQKQKRVSSQKPHPHNKQKSASTKLNKTGGNTK